MKKTITITATALAGLIIATELGMFNALFMFILAGIIPGTDIIVPANVMLLMICAVICAILLYPTAREILRIILIRQLIQQKLHTRARLPKRRFSEI